MYEILLSDKHFDKHNLQKYHLVVLPSGNFFSAVYYDKSQKKIVRYYKSDLKQFGIFLQENKNAGNKILLICSRKNSSVPYTFFSEDKLDLFFGITNQKEASEEIAFDEVLFDKIINVFAVDEYLYTTSKENGFKFRSCFTLFYDILIALYKHDNNIPVTLVGIFEGFFFLFMMQNNKVYVANVIRYGSINDFLYHILNLYDKYALDKRKTKLFFISNSQFRYEGLSKILRKYGFKDMILLSDVPNDFLSYKLTSISAKELYLFYKFLSFEDNRR